MANIDDPEAPMTAEEFGTFLKSQNFIWFGLAWEPRPSDRWQATIEAWGKVDLVCVDGEWSVTLRVKGTAPLKMSIEGYETPESAMNTLWLGTHMHQELLRDLELLLKDSTFAETPWSFDLFLKKHGYSWLGMTWQRVEDVYDAPKKWQADLPNDCTLTLMYCEYRWVALWASARSNSQLKIKTHGKVTPNEALAALREDALAYGIAALPAEGDPQ